MAGGGLGIPRVGALAASGSRPRSAHQARKQRKVGFGVLAGRALETRQVGSHGQPQMISDGHRATGDDWRQFREVRHDLTLHLLSAAAKLAKTCTR